MINKNLILGIGLIVLVLFLAGIIGEAGFFAPDGSKPGDYLYGYYMISREDNVADVSYLSLDTAVTNYKAFYDRHYWEGHPVRHADGIFRCVVIDSQPSRGNGLYWAQSCSAYLTHDEVIALAIEPPPEPPAPIITGFTAWINKLWAWIQTLFNLGAITGEPVIQVGLPYTYDISVTANEPDSDYTDGSYQVQYSNWALVDRNGNIKQEGTWERVYGSYVKQVTLIAPERGQYTLLAIITQYDMSYDNNVWVTIREEIVGREAIDLSTNIPAPDMPVVSSFTNWLNDIWDWLTNLFN